MIHSPKFTVVLDACVLYPAPVRDILLSLADVGLFKPKWSDQIQEEWTRNLLNKRNDLSKKALKSTVEAMNRAFPDSNVEDYEELISAVNLPDENDRHVLACGIRCNADLIATFNLKDFPAKELDRYDIEVQNPDELISNLIDLNEDLACKAFLKMARRLKKPLKTKKQIIETLTKCRLKASAERFDKCS